MSTRIRPGRGWVLCKKQKPRTETASGLIMAKDMDKDVVSEGVAKVVSIGPPAFVKRGRKEIPMPAGVEPGDRIIYRGFLRFAHQHGTGVMDDGEEYFFLKAADILCTVEGDGTGSVGFFDEYVT